MRLPRPNVRNQIQFVKQRIEGMTIDKNQIGKSRSDSFQYTARYRWRPMTPRIMPHCGMAAVDHRCWTWMKAEVEHIPKIFRSYSNVLLNQPIDIPRPEPNSPLIYAVLSFPR